MKILELFSGYGTSSFALKQLGINYECVGYSDIDKYANQCFKQNHGGVELGDVTKIDPKYLDDFDLLTGGFPCQPFSLSGKGLGELDTRGTLFNEIIRIAEVKKPRYMMLENVKGLLTKKHENTVKKILKELKRIGYFVYLQILDTKEHGIPQSRKRVFIICFKDKVDFDCFVFPSKEELKITVEDILEKDVDDKYYLKENQIKRLLTSTDLKKKFSVINPEIAITETSRQYDNWKGNFVVAMRGRYVDKRIIQMLEPRKDKCSNTITTVQKDNLILELRNKGIRIRQLTPKECFRLQGFLNDEVNLEGISNYQSYKLAGNGQSVNVVRKIFVKMFICLSYLKTTENNESPLR